MTKKNKCFILESNEDFCFENIYNSGKYITDEYKCKNYLNGRSLHCVFRFLPLLRQITSWKSGRFSNLYNYKQTSLKNHQCAFMLWKLLFDALGLSHQSSTQCAIY